MDFGEGNDLAEIDLTYSPMRGISRATRVLGRLIVCIIQVTSDFEDGNPSCLGKEPVVVDLEA